MQRNSLANDPSSLKKSYPEFLSNPSLPQQSLNLGVQLELASNDADVLQTPMNQAQEDAARDVDSTCSCTCRYPDGTLRLRNPHIELMERDILHHLALDTASHNLFEMFGDVKFVCLCDTPKRVERFAYDVMGATGNKLPCGTALRDISQRPDHYSMYKVGPVLAFSYGFGISSVGILLHEVIKLLYHAEARDPVVLMMGSSAGVGCDGGTLVVSDEVVDGMMRSEIEIAVLGNKIHRPAKLDRALARQLRALADPEDPYDTVAGKTMCTYDYYEGQGRSDGAFCEFTEADKMRYLRSVRQAGVLSVDMESLAFAAITHHAGVRAAVVSVALVDRLKEDQIHTSRETVEAWQERPAKLVSRFIKWTLQPKDSKSLKEHDYGRTAGREVSGAGTARLKHIT